MNNHSLEKPFQYSLKHASEALGEVTGPFVAIISRADKNGRLNDAFPKYIRISANGKKAIFQTKCVAQGKNYIYINTKALPGTDQEDDVAFDEVKQGAYLLFRQRQDPSMRLAFLGLVLGIIGILIDGSFLIGKIPSLVLFHLSDVQTGLLTVASMALKVVGLGLVYWKGIKEAK
jgi:hypothetical protein